jgi:hypothetical protein
LSCFSVSCCIASTCEANASSICFSIACLCCWNSLRILDRARSASRFTTPNDLLACRTSCPFSRWNCCKWRCDRAD